MAQAVQFQINLRGGADILRRNEKLQSLEQNLIQKIKSQVEASFLQDFGFQGKFDISGFMTDRISFQIHGADAKTKTVLQRNPKWIDQFTGNIRA